METTCIGFLDSNHNIYRFSKINVPGYTGRRM